MSQPANDDFSQHLSDDEASYHEDASDNGTATNKPKQQQQQLIPTTTTISNIKLPILKKEENGRCKRNWEAIRTRFGGNANSKKTAENYSHMEAHGVEVSTRGCKSLMHTNKVKAGHTGGPTVLILLLNSQTIYQKTEVPVVLLKKSNVNTGSFNINTVKAKQPIHTSNSNSFSPVRPQVNKFNQRSHFSKSHSPVRRPIVRNTTKMSYTHAVKGNWGTAVKTSAGSSTQKHEDRGYLISGMLRHMTGNKDHLDDFEECKGGSVTFGGSKGYITGKGRIRVEKPNVKGVGYRWMFDVDYLTDSMNYIPVSLENQTNPHAGTLEVTNNAGTLPIPNANAFVGRNEAESLNVVPTAFRHTASKV
ncbi:hypothetical protein Tco_0702716 [Tanacetum coccineum]|uniref:Uncharacterized protein n=1 Tax=Tanacetum coccineum TaxID=301880 RepID=A0ABQ4XXU1_9ASTR